MSKFEIEGPNQLSGEIAVLGAKNAALKMIAASVMISGEVILENVPDILDIATLTKILVQNGAEIRRENHTLKINTENLTNVDPDHQLVEKMRASIVLVGPYLARFGKLRLPQPGGCAIGARPIDTHIDGFKQLGVEIQFAHCFYTLISKEPQGGRAILKEASVTATENILMYAVLAQGETTINNAAKEPEIVDLANFLNKCGAKIAGAGTETITIQGVDKITATTYRVMPDRIEAGTWAALAIATNSPLKITHCRPQDLTSFLAKIKEAGVEFASGNDFVYIKDSSNLKAIKMKTAIYPGFPTDLQAPMGLILTQARGKSELEETLFENRLGYLKELAMMGAKVEMVNSRKAILEGPTPLHGAEIASIDLRAGATLILAGLAAKGKTIISGAEIVDRGYEKIEQRLQQLGAKITRIP